MILIKHLGIKRISSHYKTHKDLIPLDVCLIFVSELYISILLVGHIEKNTHRKRLRMNRYYLKLVRRLISGILTFVCY